MSISNPGFAVAGCGRPSSTLFSSSPNRPNQSRDCLVLSWPGLQTGTGPGWMGRGLVGHPHIQGQWGCGFGEQGQRSGSLNGIWFSHPRDLLSYYLSHGFLPSSLTSLEVFFLLKLPQLFSFPGTQPSFVDRCNSPLASLSLPYSCSCLQNPKNSAESQEHITLLDNPAQLRDFPNLACFLQMVQPQAQRMFLCFYPNCSRMGIACLFLFGQSSNLSWSSRC